MGICIRMRTYILEFVSNGICEYLYLMGTYIRMRTYILELVSNGICGYCKTGNVNEFNEWNGIIIISTKSTFISP